MRQGQCKTLSKSHSGLGDICSIKTESASGCATICRAESNEFPIKWTPVVYKNQILTTKKNKNLPHMCYKCKKLLKRAVYRAAALQKGRTKLGYRK